MNPLDGANCNPALLEPRRQVLIADCATADFSRTVRESVHAGLNCVYCNDAKNTVDVVRSRRSFLRAIIGNVAGGYRDTNWLALEEGSAEHVPAVVAVTPWPEKPPKKKSREGIVKIAPTDITVDNMGKLLPARFRTLVVDNLKSALRKHVLNKGHDTHPQPGRELLYTQDPQDALDVMEKIHEEIAAVLIATQSDSCSKKQRKVAYMALRKAIPQIGVATDYYTAIYHFRKKWPRIRTFPIDFLDSQPFNEDMQKMLQ